MSSFKLNFNSMYLGQLCKIKSNVSKRVDAQFHEIRPTSENIHEIILTDATESNEIKFFMTESSLWIVGFGCDSGNYFFEDYYDNNTNRKINGSKLSLNTSYTGARGIGTLGEFKSIYTTFSDFWHSIETLKKHTKNANLTKPERLAIARLIFAVSEALRFSHIQDKINEMARGYLNPTEKQRVKSGDNSDMTNAKFSMGFKFEDYANDINNWSSGSKINHPNIAIKHIKKTA